MPVLLDLNVLKFQKQWFSLEKEERLGVLNTLSKISSLEWNAVYKDKGLRWELIQGRIASDGSKLYAIRMTRKLRAVIWRRGDYMTFLTLHPDHDSAYQ